jgi:hypothetical protein
VTAITEQDRTRLIRLLGMCGSAYAGERDNAILAALRLLRQLGLEWSDVLIRPGEIAPRSTHWRDVVNIALRHTQALSPWEVRFSVSLGEFKRPSAKQLAVLREIATRVGVGAAA